MPKQWLIAGGASLNGEVTVDGAKNAVLVIMASIILTRGTSRLAHVPPSADVYNMIALLEHLGAHVVFDVAERTLWIDTEHITAWTVPPRIMQNMRASILVMGPLLARVGYADVTLPGGCVIGKRPIDMHVRAFEQLGAQVTTCEHRVYAEASAISAHRVIFDYPSVGATENALMLAAQTPGVTDIVNAALEPEVMDVVHVLRKMGANIDVIAPATLRITGADQLHPISHTIIADRLEAGTILLAAAATKGHVSLPNAPAHAMEVFLEKLREMGHTVTVGQDGQGVALYASPRPQAIAIRTMPYPGFPTDLQAPMMAALTCASGTSTVWETVYENRMLHVPQLNSMGACITADTVRAHIHGVDMLDGQYVEAPDIRGGAALLIAGMMARDETILSGVQHLERGHADICKKLQHLGAYITVLPEQAYPLPTEGRWSGRQALE